VLLTQGLLPDATRAWNRATWSISDEWVAYMLFPLLAGLIWTFRSTRACLLIAAAALLTLWLTMQYTLQTTTLDLVVVGGLLRCACGLVAGTFACKAWQLDQALLRRLAVLANGARGAIATFLFGNVVAVFLGEISYSLYLVHIGIVDLLWVPDVIAFVRPLMLPVKIGVCILAWSSLLLLSEIGYRHVERPFRTYGQQFSRRALPVRATATI
jgi:peptidoglycan/LPS O-acetylase OafA/YrhL